MTREDDIQYLAEAISKEISFETQMGDLDCVFCYCDMANKKPEHDELCPTIAARRLINDDYEVSK